MASTEIQRFSLAKGIAVWGLYADPQGEWVRWEDVQEILALKPIIIVPRSASIHRMSTPPKPLTEKDYNESLDYPHGTGPRHGE